MRYIGGRVEGKIVIGIEFVIDVCLMVGCFLGGIILFS